MRIEAEFNSSGPSMRSRNVEALKRLHERNKGEEKANFPDRRGTASYNKKREIL